MQHFSFYCFIKCSCTGLYIVHHSQAIVIWLSYCTCTVGVFLKCGFVVFQYDLVLIVPGEKSQIILFFCDLRAFGVCMREVASFARLCTPRADCFCSSEGEARVQTSC